mgnify:CR=1 FL=1
MAIWDNLNTRTLFGSSKATAAQVNSQTKDIHLEPDNRGVLLDSVLINDSLMRDGSPIPGTGVMKNVQLTDNTRTIAFTPNAGEQWELMAAGATANQAPSAGYVFSLVYTGDDQDGNQRVIQVGESASITTETGNLEGFFENKPPQYIGENTTVSVSVDAMRGTTTIEVTLFAVRVR